MKKSLPSSTAKIDRETLRKVPFALLANIDADNEISNDKRNVSKAKTSRKRPIGDIVPTQEDVTNSSNNDDDNNNCTSTLNGIDKVKEIGKKTRERLDEERSKRKEIVRLENIDFKTINNSEDQHHQSKNKSIFSQSIKQSSSSKNSLTTRNKRKKKLPRSRKSHDEVTDERSSNTIKIDSWVPQTQHLISIHQDLPKDEKSNIVRLHALPINVTTEHIRKFFSGLSPQRIFVLPSLPRTIKDFDAFSDEEWNDRTNNHGMMNETSVARYPGHFRVFVKFPSYLVADNAVARTGEAMLGASIAITPISKTFASHLQKFMAIDVKRGQQLIEALDETEEMIPTVVNEIIWIMAHQDIGLDFTKIHIGGDGSYPTIETHELCHIRPPSSDQRKEKMIILYNKLCDLYDELERNCIPFMMQDVDPILSSKSAAHRLTKTVSDWIIDQLETIKKCLDAYQYQNIL